MWFELLPTTITITALLTVPHVFVYATNNLLLGQAFKRKVLNLTDEWFCLRDYRISGRKFEYDFKGLDFLPEPEKPKVEPQSEDELVCYIRKKSSH